MKTVLQDTLRRIDVEEIRRDEGAMRRTLTNIVAAGGDLWTSTWVDTASGLYATGRVDLCLGRLVEGHADALRILDQAQAVPLPGIYGVWASRSAGTGLRAARTSDGWVLSGHLRFASGIDLIDRALIPGWVDERHHLLFDVAVGDLLADRTGWQTRAMDASRSFSCTAQRLAGGQPVGPSNFYLDRPGFEIGGIGPAAVWAGGAAQITDVVAESTSRFTLTPHQRRRLGVMAHRSWLARAVIDNLVVVLTSGDPLAVADEISHARTAVVEACNSVLDEASMIVGPAGMTQNVDLIRAHQDLGLYIRQHHLDATYERLGHTSERIVAE